MSDFSGIITQEFKDTHRDMIAALLEDTALTSPVNFVYSSISITECPNCLYNPFLGKSSGQYRSGGPIPFVNGQTCPHCVGEGKIRSTESEVINLMLIWQDKNNVKLNISSVKLPDTDLQTMCAASLYPKINNASYITINDVDQYGGQRFERIGSPEFIGFDNNFILTNWKKTG